MGRGMRTSGERGRGVGGREGKGGVGAGNFWLKESVITIASLAQNGISMGNCAFPIVERRKIISLAFAPVEIIAIGLGVVCCATS